MVLRPCRPWSPRMVTKLNPIETTRSGNPIGVHYNNSPKEVPMVHTSTYSFGKEYRRWFQPHFFHGVSAGGQAPHRFQQCHDTFPPPRGCAGAHGLGQKCPRPSQTPKRKAKDTVLKDNRSGCNICTAKFIKLGWVRYD